MKRYLLALDQGTSSSRAIIFDTDGKMIKKIQYEIATSYPNIGWVEQDPLQIYHSSKRSIDEMIKEIESEDIIALGITNQRETTIIWNKNTGLPIYPALVWQSRQSQTICDELIDTGYQDLIHQKTGLIINPYFSASKIRWILDHVEGAQTQAENGELLFGTVESWLVWQLTDGKIHVSDYTNASRTMLLNIIDLKWDTDLLKLFNIPLKMMPRLVSNSEVVGSYKNIPIAGLAGDQQAALFGHCCHEPNSIKNTYGTGCFLLMNTGNRPIYSKQGLLTTIGTVIDTQVTYALEGSVFIGGAIMKWLRDNLKLLNDVNDSSAIANSISDNDGVYFVPAFVGLGTPYWDNDVRGTIVGLNLQTTDKHIIRAALESIAYQTYDVIKAMTNNSDLKITKLTVDGGATANDFLMQFQADLLATEILVPEVLESTALGVAFLAGLGIKFYQSIDELNKLQKVKCTYYPNKTGYQKKYEKWNAAVNAAMRYK